MQKRKIHKDMEASIIRLFMRMATESIEPDLYIQLEEIADRLMINRNITAYENRALPQTEEK